MTARWYADCANSDPFVTTVAKAAEAAEGAPPPSDFAVHLDNFATDGTEKVGGSLDGVDTAEWLILVKRCADLRQIHVDHVAQLILCVVGDANGREFTVDADPLVFVCIPAILWIHVLAPRSRL